MSFGIQAVIGLYSIVWKLLYVQNNGLPFGNLFQAVDIEKFRHGMSTVTKY